MLWCMSDGQFKEVLLTIIERSIYFGIDCQLIDCVCDMCESVYWK